MPSDVIQTVPPLSGQPRKVGLSQDCTCFLDVMRVMDRMRINWVPKCALVSAGARVMMRHHPELDFDQARARVEGWATDLLATASDAD